MILRTRGSQWPVSGMSRRCGRAATPTLPTRVSHHTSAPQEIFWYATNNVQGIRTTRPQMLCGPPTHWNSATDDGIQVKVDGNWLLVQWDIAPTGDTLFLSLIRDSQNNVLWVDPSARFTPEMVQHVARVACSPTTIKPLSVPSVAPPLGLHLLMFCLFQRLQWSPSGPERSVAV